MVRAASLEDKVAVARLATQQADASPPANERSRRDRVQQVLSSLRDSHTIIHVTEVSSRLCGAVILRIAAPRRIFASAPIVSTAGRAFDPGLALRMVEHAVQCCQADGWSELRYFADFDTPDVVCGHFRRLGYDCTAKEARIGLRDRLLHGRRSHELHFRFRTAKGGSDESDPHLVWF